MLSLKRSSLCVNLVRRGVEMQKTWWKEAVCYQVYPRSFQDSNQDGIGDLNGVTRRLDYLKDLGIDVIWLSPMFKSPNDDNGYDISDYQAIMDEFGTMADFDALLEGVHARGMKLILDLVINHTSDEHEWFIESRASKDNPKRDWYVWRDGKDGAEPNNWEGIFDTPAWEYNEATDDYYLHIFSKKQPDLNWENEEVRQALFDMVNWWLDKGIDGFRVDAISHIKKDQTFKNAPAPNDEPYVKAWSQYMNVEGIAPFLIELNQKTFRKHDVMTVGEANGVGIKDIDAWVNEDNGYFNMIFQFETLGLWSVEEQHLDVLALKEGLTKWQHALADSGWNALFIENHDQPRAVSTWGNDTTYWRESAKALATMYFFMKGTPFIYQGQEIGMTNAAFDNISDYHDIQTTNQYERLIEAGMDEQQAKARVWKTNRGNSRTPMQWDAEIYGGFSKQQPWIPMNKNYRDINVATQENDSQSILHYYKDIIRLRKREEALVYGRYDLILAEHPQVYAYTRTWQQERWLVLSNLSPQAATIEAVEGIVYDADQLQLATHKVAHDITAQLTLQPYEARIYKV